MSRIQKASDLENLFAEALNVPAADLAKFFDFYEENGWLVASSKKWVERGLFAKAVELTRILCGAYRFSHDRRQGEFRIPKRKMSEQTAQGPESLNSKAPAENAETSNHQYSPIHASSAGAEKTAEAPQQIVKHWASEAEYKPVLPVKLGFHEKFPTQFIISPSFSIRLDIEEDIQELIEQISTTKASGEFCVIIQPLICRPAKKTGYVEVAAGERRLLAAREIGLSVVPIIVKNFSDEEFDRVRLMENLARKDLTDYEVARAIKYLMDTYPNTYPTQASVADVFGKTQQWVSQHLAMLQLEKDEIITRVIKPEKLSEGQAREILAAPPEKRVEVAEKIAEAGRIPSMREIRKIVKPEKTEFEEQAPIIREEEPRHAAFEIECPECHRKIAIEHVVHPNGKVTHELFKEG